MSLLFFSSQEILHHKDDLYTISMILLSLLMISGVLFFIFIIYAIITNENNFNKYRKDLKMGSETRQGIVTKIDGDDITVENTIKKNLIYPKYEDKNSFFPKYLYRYKK